MQAKTLLLMGQPSGCQQGFLQLLGIAAQRPAHSSWHKAFIQQPPCILPQLPHLAWRPQRKILVPYKVFTLPNSKAGEDRAELPFHRIPGTAGLQKRYVDAAVDIFPAHHVELSAELVTQQADQPTVFHIHPAEVPLLFLAQWLLKMAAGPLNILRQPYGREERELTFGFSGHAASLATQHRDSANAGIEAAGGEASEDANEMRQHRQNILDDWATATGILKLNRQHINASRT